MFECIVYIWNFWDLIVRYSCPLFTSHPGSLPLPFSKICQARVDADPFPVKVRFLLFQGSRLLNLTPAAFSCFLSKRKRRYASVFTPRPPPASSLGQIWNASNKTPLVSTKP